MINFVTLFNSNYLSRGLAMYKSLEEKCQNFHLYVVAFDDITFQYFQKFPEQKITLISLSQFEDEQLLSVKRSRSAAEYCWTCTASTILYAINTFKLNHCIYIDADLYFYSNPQSLIEEWGNKSILITEHRYTKEYDQSNISGIYCVQFVGFKNDADGMQALHYWRNACIEWCYAKAENGKFGDQKYLDDWTTRFKNVHVLQHLGGGIAPWNVQQNEFNLQNNKLIGKEITTDKQFEPVFFHFHGLKLYTNNVALLAPEAYLLNNSIKNIFYKPYLLALITESKKIHTNSHNTFNSNGASQISPQLPINFLSLLRWYFYDIRQSLKNINAKKTILRTKHQHYIKF